MATSSASTLCITLLGPMGAHDAEGNSVLPHLRRTRALLAILALAAPRPVPRSQLINLIWNQPVSARARGSLRQALLELKAALGPTARLLQVRRGDIALSCDGLYVDALQTAAAGPASPDDVILWNGVLLPDLAGLNATFDRWLGEQRHNLAQRVLSDAEAVLLAASEPAAIVEAADRLLGIDPTHEGAWRALIRSHAARGDRTAALAAFERCRTVLLAQCGSNPSPETADLVTDLLTVPVRSQTAPRRHATRVRLRLQVATLRSNPAGSAAEVAAALTQELLLALSRFRWLGCAHSAISEPENDADFLLGGMVQRGGERLRVLLSLIDVRSGCRIVWSDRFDSDIADVLTLPEWLASTAAARIEARLWFWEAHRSGRHDPTPRSLRELLRQAIPGVHRLDRRRFMAAGRQLNRLVELDPDDASALAWSAHWHVYHVGQGWTVDPVATIERAQDLVERAVQLDPQDAHALTLRAHVRAFLHRQPHEAMRLHEKAVEANPNLPLSWTLSGMAHTYIGDTQEGIRRLRHAQALSPCDPLDYFNEMAISASHLVRGEYAAAATAGQRAIDLNPGFSSSHKAYLAAMGHLGPDDAAMASRRKLQELEPGFSVAEALRRSPFVTNEARSIYAEGLRGAGLR